MWERKKERKRMGIKEKQQIESRKSKAKQENQKAKEQKEQQENKQTNKHEISIGEQSKRSSKEIKGGRHGDKEGDTEGKEEKDVKD